jgi:hypothetical protein
MVRRDVTIAGSITLEEIVSRRIVSWIQTQDAKEDGCCRDKLHFFLFRLSCFDLLSFLSYKNKLGEFRRSRILLILLELYQQQILLEPIPCSARPTLVKSTDLMV